MTLTTEEIFSLINSFKQLVEEQNQKIDALHKMVYEDFLGPAEENFKNWDHSVRLDDFKDKYKDTFTDELCNKCKQAEGDDNFDLAGKIFDDYEASDKSLAEEEYVGQVVASLNEQLNALKETLNAEEIKVETTDEGKVEVEADGEKVAEAETVEAEAEAETKEEDKATEAEATEEDDEADAEADFLAELEKEAEGMKKAKAW